MEAAGATAALFDMKADDGSLGYISGLALAIQAEASAADPALNAAIQLLNGGEVYTVARVSCFRDNLVPRSDMSLAIHTNAGNWRDSGDTRWLSPANESARQYVVGVCRELAALGFDEILLDNWAFPTDGELGWIKADANYPADGRTAALEVFLEEVRAGLAEFPEVKVSLVTTASAAAGRAVESGQTAALLERADRVLVRLGRGDPAPAEPDPGGARAGAGGAGPGGLGRAGHDRRIMPKSGRIALCVRFFRRLPAEEAEGKRIMLKSKLIILNLKFSPI